MYHLGTYSPHAHLVQRFVRVESSGLPNRIQVSQETADQLIKFGKSFWLTKREDKVSANGKGEITSYWISSGTSARSILSSGAATEKTSVADTDDVLLLQSVSDLNLSSTFDVDVKPQIGLDPKSRRLVKWTVENMAIFLKKIQVHRIKHSKRKKTRKGKSVVQTSTESNVGSTYSTVFDEIQESICLPDYEKSISDDGLPTTTQEEKDPKSIELSPEVMDQLESYVTTIATLYDPSNPFHNFNHASHVTLSAIKLLSRIVSPSARTKKTVEDTGTDKSKKKTVSSRRLLHDHTFGITSDPLIQFACVYSGNYCTSRSERDAIMSKTKLPSCLFQIRTSSYHP